VGGSNPHRGGFTPPVGKKTPRCAPVELGCATWLLGYGPGPGPRCRQAKPGKSRLSGVFSAGVKLASS